MKTTRTHSCRCIGHPLRGGRGLGINTQNHNQTGIVTYRLNWPRGWLSENVLEPQWSMFNKCKLELEVCHHKTVIPLIPVRSSPFPFVSTPSSLYFLLEFINLQINLDTMHHPLSPINAPKPIFNEYFTSGRTTYRSLPH